MSRLNDPTSPAAPVACALWGDAKDPSLGSMIDGLRRRGLNVESSVEPTRVMVLLARGSKLLIIDRPDRRLATRKLLEAVSRFFPAVLCWRFDPLTGLSRLQRPATPNPHADTSGLTPASIITQEELAMLLRPQEVRS